MEEKVLDFFKTFVDINRLRLAAVLSEEARTVDGIAERLHLRKGEVARLLAQIDKLGLIRQEGDRYWFDKKALETLSREVLGGKRTAAPAESNDENADEFDQKVVKNYSLPDGRLKEIPMQEKKLLSILRHVVQVFEPGVRYSEKQVNQALGRYHEDYASLRRYLVDRQMIEREQNGTAYWRAK